MIDSMKEHKFLNLIKLKNLIQECKNHDKSIKDMLIKLLEEEGYKYDNYEYPNYKIAKLLYAAEEDFGDYVTQSREEFNDLLITAIKKAMSEPSGNDNLLGWSLEYN